MKKLLTFIIASLLVLSSYAQISVQKIEPQHWYVGMKNPVVQLMVYGKNIAKSEVTIANTKAVINEIARGSSLDYLFVYLDLSQADAGNIELTFKLGKEKKTVQYPLLQRTKKRTANQTFSTADVLYLIMPDRFANGNPDNDKMVMNEKYTVDRSNPNARHGGDLKGIENRLDYLQQLGVTALWLNPVLENDMPDGSYHGYATTDYYHVDRRFGTNQDYVNLIEKAHQKGLKVVMDMIFNHCGSSHVWLNNPPFDDWFNNLPTTANPYQQTTHNKQVVFDPYRTEKDCRETLDGWFVPSMPDLNQRNRHLAVYLIQNSIWWIEYAGIDGIRQDTHFYADFDMMADWCKAVEYEYPGYNIVGENWYNNTIGSAWWQKNSNIGNSHHQTYLPTVMDFHLQSIATEAFSKESSWNQGLEKIYELLSYDFIYPDINKLLCFLENHDTDRFLAEQPDNLHQFKQGYTFLLTTRGIPQLYYGCEILMSGKRQTSDGYVRLDFPGGWIDDKTNAFEKSGRTALQNEAFDFLSKLLNWRKNNEVIAKGNLKHYLPRNGVYVYARSYQGKNVVVVMNGKNSNVTLQSKDYQEVLQGQTAAKDIITGNSISLTSDIIVPSKGIYILEW